jgi:hypothetical protein
VGLVTLFKLLLIQRYRFDHSSDRVLCSITQLVVRTLVVLPCQSLYLITDFSKKLI